MTWKEACMEQFSQYTELLEDFYASYEHLENSISAVEQCMWLKDFYEIYFFIAIFSSYETVRHEPVRAA